MEQLDDVCDRMEDWKAWTSLSSFVFFFCLICYPKPTKLDTFEIIYVHSSNWSVILEEVMAQGNIRVHIS